jgi:hypothetical protein
MEHPCILTMLLCVAEWRHGCFIKLVYKLTKINDTDSESKRNQHKPNNNLFIPINYIFNTLIINHI